MTNGARRIVLPCVVVAVLVVGLFFISSSAFDTKQYTRITDYPVVRDALVGNRVMSAFPPASTALPAGSVFRATITPMQGADSVWLYVPGGITGVAGLTGPAVSDAFAITQIREAVLAVNPGASFASPTTRMVLLAEDGSSFGAIWVDSKTGDQVFVARLD